MKVEPRRAGCAVLPRPRRRGTTQPGRCLAHRNPRHPRADPGPSHHWHPGLCPRQASGAAGLAGETVPGTAPVTRACDALRCDRHQDVARGGCGRSPWGRTRRWRPDPVPPMGPAVTRPRDRVSPMGLGVASRTRCHPTDLVSLAGPSSPVVPGFAAEPLGR